MRNYNHYTLTCSDKCLQLNCYDSVPTTVLYSLLLASAIGDKLLKASISPLFMKVYSTTCGKFCIGSNFSSFVSNSFIYHVSFLNFVALPYPETELLTTR